MFESVIPIKRPVGGTCSRNEGFVHKGLGLSQQVLNMPGDREKVCG